MGQRSPYKSGGGKVVECLAAHDVADKCKIGREYQTQEVANKPCIASMPSKSHEAGRVKTGKIIWKPHRLGIDV